MAETVWELQHSDDELLIETGVEGPAAKMGHRLTLTLPWQARVRWRSGQPVAAEMTADVSALQVVRGDGGLTGLSGPEKLLARSNAIKSLNAKRFRYIVFRTDSIERSQDGYRLIGTLDINGMTRERVVDLRVEDAGDRWQMTCRATVCHTEFGLKPYSLMMGAMKVADEVVVSFSAERVKDQ